jgi:hypothetical protein
VLAGAENGACYSDIRSFLQKKEFVQIFPTLENERTAFPNNLEVFALGAENRSAMALVKCYSNPVADFDKLLFMHPWFGQAALFENEHQRI